MAVRTRDELITAVNAIIGETPDDKGLSLLEDISDTFASYDDTEDWKTKYEENDAEWRKRYKERFEGKKVVVEEIEDGIPKEKTKFEELFEEVK